MKILMLVMSLSLAGCTSFPFCQKLLSAMEDEFDPGVYDVVTIKTHFVQDWGGSKMECSVSVAVSGYIGQKDELRERPDYIDNILQ